MTEYRSDWTVSFTNTLLEAATGGRWLDREIKAEIDRFDDAVASLGGERESVSYGLIDVRFDEDETFESYDAMDAFLMEHRDSDYEIESVEAVYTFDDASLAVSYDPYARSAFEAMLDADAEHRAALEKELSQPFYRTGWRRLLDLGRRWRI